ncbi:hypothetical protein SUGI_0061520 [Cryptomeria japonica]|nr:hypothetical protein SUGI_0061520 [Cryptomeria japonica]
MEMEPNLGDFFNEDHANSSHPNHVPIHPIDGSHDEEEALTRVSLDQLSTLDNQFYSFQQWMSQEYPNSEALPLIEGLKCMIQSDKNGIDILCGISHIVDSNVMPIKSCAETLGYSQLATQINSSIPLSTPITSIPTFTSNIMATSTQNVIPTTIGHGGNPSSSFYPPSLPMTSMSVPIIPQPIDVTQGGNSFNNFIPPLTVPFPIQSSPMSTYHNVPPPYSQSMSSFNNITPPSQSPMSNINSSTEVTINNLAQTVSSLQQQIASMSQSKFSVPTFDVVIPLFS